MATLKVHTNWMTNEKQNSAPAMRPVADGFPTSARPSGESCVLRGRSPAASNPRRHHPEHRGSAAASTVLPTAPANTTAMKGSHCTQNAKQSEANTSRMSNADTTAAHHSVKRAMNAPATRPAAIAATRNGMASWTTAALRTTPATPATAPATDQRASRRGERRTGPSASPESPDSATPRRAARRRTAERPIRGDASKRRAAASVAARNSGSWITPPPYATWSRNRPSKQKSKLIHATNAANPAHRRTRATDPRTAKNGSVSPRSLPSRAAASLASMRPSPGSASSPPIILRAARPPRVASSGARWLLTWDDA